MFKKCCIVLFITIFCNGVAHSSPTKANSSDLILNEQAAVTEAVSHIKHKIELINTAPDAGVHHTEKLNVSTSPEHSITEDKTTSNSTRVEKNTNQSSNTKIDTKTVTDAPIKSPNATLNGSASNSPMPTAAIPTVIPVTHVNITADLPPRNSSDMSRPIVAGQSTTTVTILPVGMTTKAPVTSPTVVTPTPAPAVSKGTDNVILVHDSSKNAQENRFDGASFVGGIVLTIGLTAIGFIAFKYYKSGKIDGNYRSL